MALKLIFFPLVTCGVSVVYTGSVVKTLTTMQEMEETQVPSLGQEDPLEEGIEPHSSILAWKIPWAEEPGRL